MADSTAKTNMLQSIRKALEVRTPMPFPQSAHIKDSFRPPHDDLTVIFAQEFTQLGGYFSICTSAQQLKAQLSALFSSRGWQKIYCAEPGLSNLIAGILPATTTDLEGCDASVTGCEYLIARTGSFLLSSARPMGRTASVYAPVHICIADAGQLLYDIDEGLQSLQEKYGQNWPSFVTLASGPSRTADIEKTLVTGVHGPKEVFCFLVDHSLQNLK